MFKVAGPLWAQAAGADNVFARLVKTGKKVLRRVLRQQQDHSEVPRPSWSLRAQQVQVPESSGTRLIGGLFPQHLLRTQAAEVRRQAALRLIRGTRKVPVFAFVGLSLGVGAAGSDSASGGSDDVLCSGIRELFAQHGVKGGTVEEGGRQFSLETLQLGNLIGKGCNAAVFEARPFAPDNEQERLSSAVSESEAEEASEACVAEGETNTLEGTEEDSLVDDTDPANEVPPAVFHTDDHVDKEDDEDFIVIDENEVDEADEKAEGGAENCGEGWVLYRVSGVAASQTAQSHSSQAEGDFDDSDSDIFILAGDGEGLESLPDPEAMDVEWSMVQAGPPEVSDEADVASDSSNMADQNTSSTDLSSEDTLTTDSTDSSSGLSAEAPEPAPNIEGSEDFPLAVKMMFNYHVESQSERILVAMAKETVPAHTTLPQDVLEADSMQGGLKKLPPHPNIVEMHGVFVDLTPDLPEGAAVYPSALPPRLNREGGFGRNATMFLVMKKYDMTLREYLSAHDVSVRTRCLLFSQLLEGVAHLGHHGIAHRDLKSDNVLVDLSQGIDQPRLVISDFGCCLADPEHGLELPYPVGEVDKGGNGALMAPEIKAARPGRASVLDYTKADLWAAGALGYEIFGEENPFYRRLDARSYREEDLQPLPENTPGVVRKLVGLMLKKNPSERPMPATVATAMQIFLWAPRELQPFGTEKPIGYNPLWKCKELWYWLERLTMETVCQRVWGTTASRLDLTIKSAFLSRVGRRDVFAVIGLEE